MTRRVVFLVFALLCARGSWAQQTNVVQPPSCVLTVGGCTLTAPLNIGTPSITDTGVLLQATSSVAGFNQIILQNTSNATNASANFVVNNNLGTATTYSGEFGMNSSTFTGTGSLNAANSVYLDSQSVDLAIGTVGSNAIHIVANSGATDAITISSGNIPTIRTPTIGGTLTLADGATWGTTGFADTASYSGSTPAFNFAPVTSLSSTYATAFQISPTVNFSGTGTGIGNALNGLFTPTGASLSDLQAWRVAPTIYNNSVNVSNFEAMQVAISSSSYTGTITNGADLEIGTIGGFSPAITSSYGIRFLNGTTNGNGITSGAVTNSGISEGGAWSSAAAAAGGTVNNYGAVFGVANASGAGTTTNIGVYITGNGGSGGAGTTNNWALYSDSTALSSIGGQLRVGANSADYLTLTGGASSATLSTNGGALILTSGGGTTLSMGDTAPAMPNLASSASALDAMCWNATGGVITHNGAGALCSASLRKFKDILGPITAQQGLDWTLALKPVIAKYKDDQTGVSDHRLHPMFIAEDVEQVSPYLATYDKDGALYGVRYMEMAAVNTAAIQALNTKIDALPHFSSCKEGVDCPPFPSTVPFVSNTVSTNTVDPVAALNKRLDTQQNEIYGLILAFLALLRLHLRRRK